MGHLDERCRRIDASPSPKVVRKGIPLYLGEALRKSLTTPGMAGDELCEFLRCDVDVIFGVVTLVQRGDGYFKMTLEPACR